MPGNDGAPGIPDVVSADSLGGPVVRSLSADSSVTGGGMSPSAGGGASPEGRVVVIGGTLSDLDGAARPAPPYDCPRNSALVFVKPHANRDAVRELVEATLLERIPSGRITRAVTVTGHTIGRRRLIDRHYAVLARHATEVDVGALKIDKAKFKTAFKEKWPAVLRKKRACNALQALSRLGCNPAELEAAWRAAESESKTAKLAPGLYVGLLSVNGGKVTYVVNGFYMAMRGKFVGDGKSIRAYLLEWDEEDCSWEDFRTNIVGATNPTKAVAGSLRRTIYERWEQLGMDAQPSTGDNAVHASASPLEGMAEKCNWMGLNVAQDDFGRALLGRGISEPTIIQWMSDPDLKFPSGSEGGSQKIGSLFDDVENTDASRCMHRLLEIYDDGLFGPGGCCTIS